MDYGMIGGISKLGIVVLQTSPGLQMLLFRLNNPLKNHTLYDTMIY